MIKKCDCKHEDQDRINGKGERVHNETSSKPPKYRCTVCLKEKD